MADVFISYAREDKSVAAALARSIEREGLTVWWDPAIRPHEDYTAVIDAEIAKAAAVVVLWSRTAFESAWVRSEASEALAQRKLVQAVLEPTRIPRPFDQFQAADLSTWSGEGEHEGRRAISASLRELAAAKRRGVSGREAPAWPDAPKRTAPKPRARGGASAFVVAAVAALAAAGGYLYASNPMIGQFLRYGGAVKVDVTFTVNAANVAKVSDEADALIAENEAIF